MKDGYVMNKHENGSTYRCSEWACGAAHVGGVWSGLVDCDGLVDSDGAACFVRRGAGSVGEPVLFGPVGQGLGDPGDAIPDVVDGAAGDAELFGDEFGVVAGGGELVDGDRVCGGEVWRHGCTSERRHTGTLERL